MAIARVVTPTITTATVTVVPQTTVSTELLAPNLNRKGLSVFNFSNKVLYLKLGPSASTSDWSIRMAPGATLERAYPTYAGQITGTWAAAGSGSARVTEEV